MLKSIQLATGAPETFLHIRQWQYSAAKGVAEIWYLTDSHRHPPSNFFILKYDLYHVIP